MCCYPLASTKVAVDHKLLTFTTNSPQATKIVTENRGFYPEHTSKRHKKDIGLIDYDYSVQVAIDWKSLAINTKTWCAPRIITRNREVDHTYPSKRHSIDIGLVACD